MVCCIFCQQLTKIEFITKSYFRFWSCVTFFFPKSLVPRVTSGCPSLATPVSTSQCCGVLLFILNWRPAKMQRFRSTVSETLPQSRRFRRRRRLKLTSAAAQLFGGLSPASYCGHQSGLSAIVKQGETAQRPVPPPPHNAAVCVFHLLCFNKHFKTFFKEERLKKKKKIINIF